jgi:hypothetical protein
MARSSLLVHVVMIVIAGAIGYLYIYPTIQQIRQNQDTAVIFDREANRVSLVNSQLQQKIASVNSIPLQDRQKLLTYMPDTLDEVAILRTMESILLSVGIEPATLEFGSIRQENSSSDSFTEAEVGPASKTVSSTVSVMFEASETALFAFFEAVEKSALPFIEKEISLAPDETGRLIAADLVYTVHALAPAVVVSEQFIDDMGF